MTRLYDCSPKQEEDWETHQDLGPQILIKNISVANYQGQKMEQAFASVIAKHESLRTIFVYHQGKLYQRVLEGDRTEGFYLRYLGAPPVEAPDTLKSARQHLRDLSKGPLFFLLVKQHDDGSATLVLLINHIISDYRSLLIFKNDLLTAYNGLVSGNCTTLKPLPLQLKDYVKMKNGQLPALEARHEAYWRAKLEPSFLQRMQDLLWSRLCNDGKDPFEKTEGSGRCVLYLDPETYRRTRQLAARSNVSTLAIFVTGFGLALSEYFSTPELLISSVVSDRRDQCSIGLIAFLVGCIHMRIKTDTESGYDALVQKTYMEFLRSCRYLIFNYRFLYDLPLREANMLHITYQPIKDETADFWMEEPGHKATPSPYFALACNISADSEHCKLEIYYHGSFFLPENVDRIIMLFHKELEKLTEPLLNQSNNHVTPSNQQTNNADLDGAIPR